MRCPFMVARSRESSGRTVTRDKGMRGLTTKDQRALKVGSPI